MGETARENSRNYPFLTVVASTYREGHTKRAFVTNVELSANLLRYDTDTPPQFGEKLRLTLKLRKGKLVQVTGIAQLPPIGSGGAKVVVVYKACTVQDEETIADELQAEQDRVRRRNSVRPRPKPSLLFVDDDRALLDGLNLRLWDYRNSWEMNFVDCSEQALRMATSKFFDVVVSDLQMPGMDGMSLMKKIKWAQPYTVCVALSGKLGRFKGADFVQAALPKPCPVHLLEDTLSHVLLG